MLIMSINVLSKTCSNCGAPLSGYLCLYCDTEYKPAVDLGYRIPEPRPELVPAGLFEVELGSARYRVRGRIAVGGHSEVLLARTACAATRQVVLKVAEDVERLESEWSSLRHLQHRNSYLDRLLPQPLKLGSWRGKAVLVTGWRSGFVHTLAYARKRRPTGLDPAALVWIWSRVLDQITVLRDLGYSHRALRPEHLLVHPRDHGVAFCGWGEAVMGAHQDLADSGRCLTELMGNGAPRALRELAESAYQFDRPHHLQSELKKVARAEFGPPRFVPFAL